MLERDITTWWLCFQWHGVVSYWPGPDRLLSMNFLFAKHIHHCKENKTTICIRELVIYWLKHESKAAINKPHTGLPVDSS